MQYDSAERKANENRRWEIEYKFFTICSKPLLQVFMLPLVHACMHAKSLQSCPALCDSKNCSCPGSYVHGILQTRILELVAILFSRGSSQPRDLTRISAVSCTAGVKSLYCLSHQGRPWILEWVAYPFSRGSSRPRNQIWISCIAGGFFTSWATREAQKCLL